MPPIRSLSLATAFAAALSAAAAQAPADHLATAPPASIDAPLIGTTEVLEELRAVSYHRADGVRTYGIVAEDIAKYFPAAVSERDGAAVIDPSAMAAVLLSLVKDLKDANTHLNAQLEHVIYDRADTERRLHALEAQLAELRASTAPYATASAKESRRHGGSARN